MLHLYTFILVIVMAEIVTWSDQLLYALMAWSLGFILYHALRLIV